MQAISLPSRSIALRGRLEAVFYILHDYKAPVFFLGKHTARALRKAF